MTELPISVCESDWPAADIERDLVERARRDREAFGALYRRHYGAIAGYVYRRVGDAHATEDLVSEVFVAAMRSIGRYRYRGVPFRAWLYRIATNVVNRWAKRNRRLAGGAITESVEWPNDSSWDAEVARRALLKLPAKQQAALSLFYFEGLALEEVAAICGCRVGTVKSRLARGRDALRESLERGR